MRVLVRVSIIILSCQSQVSCSDASVELSGGYHYYNEGADQSVIVAKGWRSADPYIPCNVEKYAWNDQHIVVRQLPVQPCFWEGAIPTGSDENVPIANFWIIEVAEQLVLGPFTSEEFEYLATKHEVDRSLVRVVSK